MTDITPLTQSEINDALAQLKQLSEYPTPSTQYARVLRKYFASLVEALEKAQAQSSKWLEAYHKAVSIGARYEERIAELESRTVTVKLPEPFKLAKSSSGLTYYYADEVNEALTEQGIKWEAE
ncbi:hypothetical protein [Raoultella ornithinolytica]|uniref:hypothetical protein n=1 Tax=Raoultella ornithinolytica TaxID=54291 RepID=UPI0004D9CE70|nr:hypothetical protein [Raoultella ornithinolytica]KDV92903.1 hypothetical protein AB00_3062 [Raoultella ornithinolytica 2-156-04_S1_C1]KDX13147.1 hypothetical protein AB28_3069 [Raoultella ornithinolytica 2-156-04_S1_C2]